MKIADTVIPMHRHEPEPTSAPKKADAVSRPAAHSDSPGQISPAKFNAKVNENAKPLIQRTVTVGPNPQFSKTAKVEELFGQLMGSESHNMGSAVRKLRKHIREGASLEEILDHAGGDPAQAMVMLRGAYRQATSDNNSQEFIEIGTHLKNLENHPQHGPKIKAGANTARAFGRYVVDPKKRKNMRSLYYDSMVAVDGLLGMLDALLTYAGREDENTNPNGPMSEKDFIAALKILTKALADDMGSSGERHVVETLSEKHLDLREMTPQAQTVFHDYHRSEAIALRPSRPHLQKLMNGIKTARKLGHMIDKSNALLARMRVKNPSLDINGPLFLRHIVTMMDKGMNSGEIRKLTLLMGGSNLSNQLAFLNGFSAMAKEMHRDAWRDPNSRLSSLNNIDALNRELTKKEKDEMGLPNPVLVAAAAAARAKAEILRMGHDDRNAAVGARPTDESNDDTVVATQAKAESDNSVTATPYDEALPKSPLPANNQADSTPKSTTESTS